MRLAIIVISLLLLILIIVLTAGSKNLTLQSEHTSQEKVIVWLKSANRVNEPIPILQNYIQLGQTKIALEKKSLFYSNGNNYLGTIEKTGDRKNLILTIRWYDPNGSQIGQFIDPIKFDDPFPFYQIDSYSDNLVSVDIYNHVRIVDPSGELVKDFKIIEDYRYHSENMIEVLLQDQTLYVGITEILPQMENHSQYKSYIRVINLNGDVLLHHKMPGWQIRKIQNAKDGKYIAVSGYRKDIQNQSFKFLSRIIDRGGDIIYELPFRFRNAVFNDLNSQVLLMDKSSAKLIDLPTRRVTAELGARDTGNLFLTGIFLDESGKIVIEEGKISKTPSEGKTPWNYTDLKIRIFSKDGEEGNDLLLEGKTLYKPALWFNHESNSLFVGHSQGWQIYDVNF